MVQENRNRMTMLQYSSRKGRNYYLYQLAACLLSAFILIAAEFLFYMLTAKLNRVIDFWNAPAASFASGYIGWFPWSLGTMSMMNVLFCAMTAVGAADTLCCDPLLQKLYHSHCLGPSPGYSGRVLWRISGLSFYGDHEMEVSGACSSSSCSGNRDFDSRAAVHLREEEKYRLRSR